MYFLNISILFNLFWFAAVIGQQQLLPLLIISLLLALLLQPKSILPATSMAAIGIIGDSFLSILGIFHFDDFFLPLWLCCLWLGFSIYLHLAGDFLLQKPKWIILLFGSFGGAMSYLAGEKLGAVSFQYSSIITALVLIPAWFVYSSLFWHFLTRRTTKGK